MIGAATLSGSLVAGLLALGMFTPATASPDNLPLQTCKPDQVRASQRYWAFGNSAGIDFGVSGNSRTAIKVPGTTVEGSTVVTDTTGQMLFWSNGSTLFDRNNSPMPNGSGLKINSSATQTVAAFPSIEHPGVYFVVTTTGASEVGGKGQLYYSKVDMSLNGGLGDVTSTKNVPLGAATDATEALTAVPNADGTGFWVLTFRAGTPYDLAYEFDGDGPVTGQAVESEMSSPNGNRYATFNISNDLSQIVQMTGSSAGTGQIRLLSINGQTGVLTEKATWDLATGTNAGADGYSADFSPAGDYVYATKIFSGAHLYRYKIAGASSAADIKASEENLASIGNGGQVRKGPDGREYVVNRTAGSLSVLNTPDAADPGLVLNGFPLAAGTSNGWGLPQTVTGCPKPAAPTVEVTGPEDGATYEWGSNETAAYTCEGTDVTECSAVDENGNPVDPGDPIDTQTPGTHTMTVTAKDENGNVTTKTVTYTVKPRPNQPPTAQVNGPAEGATYFQGQDVPADYSCSDPDGTVASCTGDVAKGGKVDTGTPGTKTFSVTATDNDGASTTKKVTYKVVAVNGVCKGQVLGLPLGINLGVANAPTNPCATQTSSLLDVNEVIGGVNLLPILNNTVTATAVQAHAIKGVGSAAADETVASAGVRIPSLALTIAVTGVHTDASSKLTSCSAPAQLSGSSTIASLKINGLNITVGDQPLTIPLVVGNLYLNQKVVSGNTITRRALFLDLPGTALDVVIGESTAGATCAS